ncbi:MAG: DUF4173 domain-containing protein [Bacteroidota bacterium]
MTIKKSELGIEVFLGALLLGIIGERLLFETGWGVGAMLWVGAVAALGVWLVARWDAPLLKFERWLLLPLGMLALSFIGRDASMLKFATTMGLFAVLGLSMQSRQLHRVAGRVPGLLSTGFHSLLGYPRFLRNTVRWEVLFAGLDKETARSIVRGVLLVMPVLLVFGLLLSAADAGFGDLMYNLISVDMGSLPTRLLVIGVYTLLAGAYLRGIITDVVTDQRSKQAKGKKLKLLMLEVGIVLGLVNLMFATFVIMQLGYLFGGAEYIQAASGITLSSYARHGFFELIAVAAISLGMTLILKRCFKPTHQGHTAIFNALVVIQVGLLLVMLVSAAQRMWLYAGAYGLTELRLYASAFIVWLAFVLGWFSWSTIKNDTLNFMRGAVVAGAVVVLGLHIVNPEALIVKTNMQRAIAGAELDHEYLLTLSADAVPAMLELLPELNMADQRKLAGSLYAAWQTQPENDWRSWNLSHYRARVAMEKSMSQGGLIVSQLPLPLQPADLP